MPGEDYLKITVDDFQVEVTSARDLPVSISYKLENPENFQQKTSAEGFDIELPAVLMNDVASNGMRSAEAEDLTPGSIFKSARRGVIEAGGFELLVGKAFLKNAKHNSKPLSYTYNFYGDNADWIIDLADKTLYDFLKNINFVFNETGIIASWAFDGTNEALPYVFAPVRYRYPPGGYTIDDTGASVAVNDNFLPENMKPALSKYFILYWAFQSLGYRIESNFFDQPYFRRQVMPWTWGAFLNSEGTKLEVHYFLAKSEVDQYYDAENGRNSEIWDLKVTNDSKDGGFDNNNDYAYNAPSKEMVWQYKAPYFGILDATFSLSTFYSAYASGNSEVELRAQWFKNGVQFDCGSGNYNQNGNLIVHKTSTGVGGEAAGNADQFATVRIDPADNNGAGTRVSVKIYRSMFESKVGNATIKANILSFKLDFFRIPLGGTIDFQNFTGFQKYKFTDYVAGIIDEFDLSINTDSISKIVYFEPTHPYSTGRSPIPNQPGYFKNDFIDWNAKEDLDKEWQLDNFADESQELIFSYKPDTADGILKLVQDRNINTLAAAKYVFPNRFQKGSKKRENRFFGATMHFELDNFKTIGTGANLGISPQFVCLVPDNISSTSQEASENTFLPKSCYYKGLVTGVGAWRFNGIVKQELPFMFAVNYKPGGYNDPILSYTDELIPVAPGDTADQDGYVFGRGLLKRFIWQRLAIMRNGQFYTASWFRLKNSDVAGRLHREFISFIGQKWELIQITGFKPLVKDSTKCLLYKWSPVTQEDADHTFPSQDYILNGTTPPDGDSTDIKYAPLKCLITDIPSS